MAVSKRTRFEVLKRDNYTCRYCRSTENPLTVDHVIPVARGGSDAPSNLVAACKDCNAGKSSSNPHDLLVADVKADDLRWNAALARVAQARAQQHEKRTAYAIRFLDVWDTWHYGPNKAPIPLPATYEQTLNRFYELGVPIEDIQECAAIALSNDRVAVPEIFRYFAGCVWRVVDEMRDAAREIVGGEQ